MIARVFPRKTAMSPTDALAFFGQPTVGVAASDEATGNGAACRKRREVKTNGNL